MAKSIRSKWKRKCRAVKRQRYAVKELAILKKTLGIKEDALTDSTMADDVANDTTEQVIFLDAGEIKKKKKQTKVKNAEPLAGSDVEMSSDDEHIVVDADKSKKRIFNTKTMKDQNGQYPGWLSKRKIAKLSQKDKKNKKKTKKKRSH